MSVAVKAQGPLLFGEVGHSSTEGNAVETTTSHPWLRCSWPFKMSSHLPNAKQRLIFS